MGNPTRDFNSSLDLAAGLVTDALNVLRTCLTARLPTPHRRHVQAAIRCYENGQRETFLAANDPWSEPEKPRQMELL